MYVASLSVKVRRPDDDRLKKSKHVASHTINKKIKIFVFDVIFYTFFYVDISSNQVPLTTE